MSSEPSRSGASTSSASTSPTPRRRRSSRRSPSSAGTPTSRSASTPRAPRCAAGRWPRARCSRPARGRGAGLGIRHYALSFASSAGDVELIRALVPEASTVISKIESRAGVRNRDEIIDASDAVLIDRGDLSREVPVEYVPYYQKAIVRQANRWNTPVYVATNLLESMVTHRKATIAEMNDIANTLIDGVHGLVLAAETAMGVDPVGAVDAVTRCIKSFEHTSMGSLLEEDRLGRIA